jgi:hypothetical protein
MPGRSWRCRCSPNDRDEPSSAARVRRRAWLKPRKFPHRRTPTETRFAPAAVINTGWTGALPSARKPGRWPGCRFVAGPARDFRNVAHGAVLARLLFWVLVSERSRHPRAPSRVSVLGRPSEIGSASRLGSAVLAAHAERPVGDAPFSMLLSCWFSGLAGVRIRRMEERLGPVPGVGDRR